MKETIERFGDWFFDKGIMWIVAVAVGLLVSVMFVQVGIWHGRLMATEELGRDMAVNRTIIAGLEIRAAALEKEIETHEIVLQIIGCESDFRHINVWGDGKTSYGIGQYKRKTFYWLAEKAGMTNLNWKDRQHQITLMKWAVEHGYAELWSCYNKASLSSGAIKRGIDG